MESEAVRAVKADDYKDIAEILACPGVVRNTSQLPYVSLDGRKNWLENLGPDVHILVAEVDGRVVGYINLTRLKNRLAHVGHVGMAVHDDFQDRGIGSILMRAALDMADNWLNLVRVELHVYTDNLRAIHLYEKTGFVIEGTRKAIAYREGTYADAHFMARIKSS